VSRALKAKGWRVQIERSAHVSYVFQAYVVADHGIFARTIWPRTGVPAPQQSLHQPAFLSDGRRESKGRMYFTPDNAGRIDAAREKLESWRKAGMVGEDSYYLLLRRS